MQNLKYVDAPRFKGVSVPQSAELKLFRDSQVIATDADQFGASELRFFPATASQNAVDSNYESNPLPRNRSYDILGVGVGFSLDALRVTEADQGALPEGLFALRDAIFHSRLLFETSSRQELIDDHLHTCSGAKEVVSTIETGADATAGDGLSRTVKFPDTLTVRRSDPLHVEPQETWDLDIQFEDSTALPQQSAYGTLGQGTLRMVATMLVAYQ